MKQVSVLLPPAPATEAVVSRYGWAHLRPFILSLRQTDVAERLQGSLYTLRQIVIGVN